MARGTHPANGSGYVTNKTLYDEMTGVRAELTRVKIGMAILFTAQGAGLYKLFGTPLPSPQTVSQIVSLIT